MIESYADHQRRARRQSWLLVALFVGGFAATILSFWLIVSGGLALRHDVEWRDSVQEWRMLGIVTGLIVLIVLYGSIRTLWRLRHGGPAIAAMLGGVEVARDTYDADERKLLNVVEEMSLASGLPMPRVYLLADDTINAFAAGDRPGNAVVGFTRGAVERLTRDELQAVAAHEFSHIYHGDPRINARTVAAIGGIMAIGVFGWVLLRYLGPAMLRAESRGGRGKKKEGGGAIVVMLAGLVMWIVGSVGVLFGRLIQAAISRRREYLADASAVDYTRNPDGIAGALRKIRDQGSAAVASEAASELNHFFFASSVRSLFATHPPLDRRIERAVAMGAKATWEPSMPERPAASSPTDGILAAFTSSFLARFGQGLQRPAVVPCGGAILWLADWSAELRGKIRTPAGARAACYAAIAEPGRADEIRVAIAGRDPEAARLLPEFAAAVDTLRDDRKVAAVELAAPALVAMGSAAYRDFRESIRRTIRTDGEVSLREWAAFVALRRHVEANFGPAARSRIRRTIADVPDELRTVLAFGVTVSQRPIAAAAGFRVAYESLGLRAPPLGDPKQRTIAAFDEALGVLATLDLAAREQVLRAFVLAVSRDGEVHSAEHLLLRGVAESLDIPVPAVGG
jgi:Zn-dependent protease with chaperone function